MPANTTRGLPYPLPSEPVAEGAQAIRNLAEAVDPLLAAGTPSATPPASPVNGQLWVLPADAANGIVWLLRYNAGSASAYKWEFVGGSPMRALIPTDEVIAGSGSWLDPPTVGPGFTAPRAGEYLADAGCGYYNAAATYCYTGISVNNAAPTDPTPAIALPAGNGAAIAVISAKILCSTASLIVKLRHQPGAASTHVTQRWINLRPIRLS